MREAEDIRPLAVAALREVQRALSPSRDVTADSMLRKLEAGAPIYPIRGNDIPRALSEFADAARWVAELAPDAPEGLGIGAFDASGPLRQAESALDRIKAGVTFSTLRAVLAGSYASDTVRAAISEVESAMDAHGDAAEAAPGP